MCTQGHFESQLLGGTLRNEMKRNETVLFEMARSLFGSDDISARLKANRRDVLINTNATKNPKINESYSKNTISGYNQ